MAFYKLFAVIHRRTDFARLWEEVRIYMNPEYRRKREENRKKACQTLSMFYGLSGLIDSFRKEG